MPAVGNYAGTWRYYAGVDGTVNTGDQERLLAVMAIATAAGASFTIDGGDSIPVPENFVVFLNPEGHVENPTIVFTGTTSYFVETLR